MSGNIATVIAQLIPVLFAFLIALSVHECAHALAAFLLGDDTAKRMGRLTLNPLAHIDPFGLLALIIFRIGWAKPVMFDQRNFKYPKLGAVITGLAGPFSNFLLTIATFVVLKYIPFTQLSPALGMSIQQVLVVLATISTMLGVFNLIPIPPLDGGHLITALFLEKYPRVLLWLHQYSIFILLGLIWFPATQQLLMGAISGMYTFLHGLVF